MRLRATRVRIVSSSMTSTLAPGLLILHGNRLELLRDAVFDWLARNPLEPMEEEIFLVQSNAAAEWIKMSAAHANGICAATRVELPGRFLWRTYRDVLGRSRVAAQSALDREALAWRLMRVLPTLLEQPAFEPVARFLADRDPDRRLQLARRLADLYDQYQVYRADWLDAWEKGRANLTGARGEERPVPTDQR
jgi:exodeoxyribonuclease V gamma subunit